MKTRYIYILLIIFLVSSCKKDFLEVKNMNDADLQRAWSNPEDVKAIASGMFFNWHKTQYWAYTFSPIMAMWTMADQGTASWGNGAMQDLSSEPRAEFVNTQDYSHIRIIKRYYERLYGNINTANDIINVIKNGMQLGEIDEDGIGEDTEMIKAFAYFNQGISLGYLALVFDKAYVIKESSPDENILTPYSYKDVADSAILSLEKCIEISDANDFSLPEPWINGSSYSNIELSQLAHSFIARILVGNPRNIADNNEVDWNKVYSHANQGIQRDLAPYMDNIVWKNLMLNYTFNNTTLDWCGVDSRIIHMMDNNYPAVYPDLSTEPKPDPAVSDDHRLETDFRYDATCPLKADRGYYHFFDYEYKRYSSYTINNPANVVDFYVTENDLIKAEAMFHNGNKSGAIDILNNGPRVTRGQLPPLDYSISDEDFLKALFYERDIELMMTGFGTPFFDMRRRDMLQKGTMLHFPIPAKELDVMSMPLYTFGGVENADGINTSNGGWK